MNYTNEIEQRIKLLKVRANNDERVKQYNFIASGITKFLRVTKTNKFDKNLILSFFPSGYFPKTTQNRHIKRIIDLLKFNGVIKDDTIKKKVLIPRRHVLHSNDYDSYKVLMNKNGYKTIFYYEYDQNKNGLPSRRVIGKSQIGLLPRDKNGLIVDKFDAVELKQTKPRDKQGVYSYGNKSIAFERQQYTKKAYLVI